jgi:hypothetical protein
MHGKSRNSGLPKDEVAIAGFVSELSAKLDAYEIILGKQKFLGGDVSPSQPSESLFPS